uniref:Non-structural protein 2 n=1 Tax=Aleutian mink disease parvovirus TaxID=28314 RepID=A0A6C0W5V5_9VIRU|nr:non-structural protein 2 [Aleutian mink disease parvovirus]
MAQAQLDEQRRLQDLYKQFKKEVADGEGLAWLFQQKTYTDKDNKPTKATPPLRTTSSDLRDYWTKVECHNCHEEFWHLTTYYCKECRKCEHGKLRHTKKGCEQCACKAAQETSA